MFPKRSISICSTTEPTRKKNTIKTCDFVHRRFTGRFGQRDLASISQEEVLEFLLAMTQDHRQATKRNRYSVLASFCTMQRLGISTVLTGFSLFPMSLPGLW